ncbi:MAG: asparagine--tRNA ligase [Bacilli bacterium]|jgi:asparaginyl-tRNA synthetase|nr:asparagine--tRNA ligase [Bacilli bacterium]
MDLKDLLKNISEYVNKEVVLEGWVRNNRNQSNFGFIDFNDGTCFKSLQLVYENELSNFDMISHIRVGSAIRVKGNIVESVGSGQSYELKVSDMELLGDSPEDYPIQPKRHTREFLREVAHLRPRTNLFNAVFRVRSVAAQAIHEYFQNNNYVYFHSPIITGADCEGSGEMFKVTTFDMSNLPLDKEGKVDYKKDLFGKPTYITGSGQLHGETYAMAYKKIYTFGPTMRTEKSNTKTHANEFWMIEPEVAFCDLDGIMDIEEDMLKYVVKYVMDKCSDELEFFDKFVEKGLLEKLNKVVNSNFVRITHEEAITLLKEAKVDFEFKPEYGEDIAKEHERYITEHFNGPVFIKDWPKDIKAFYMKLNEDGKTVAAVDLEVPGSGELMGGSQREDDYDKLITRMEELNIPKENLEWYTNLRRFGGCYHSGFGLGFERLIMYLTGVENIRDVIPYPRTPNSCDY